jgi:riboflavin transporter FmnP
MKNKNFKPPISSSYKISTAAVLGALSIFFVLTPDIRLPWGMAALDFIALPWIIAFLLLGLKGGLLTSSIGFLGIFFLSEEAIPYVGAIMKFSATVPMIIIPTLILNLSKFKYSSDSLKSKRIYAFLMAIAIVVRCLVMLLLNYYFAIPVMFGLTPSEVPFSFNYFFWGNQMQPNVLMYYILGVSLWNTWQGIIDAVLSWLVVFPTNLHKQLKFW